MTNTTKCLLLPVIWYLVFGIIFELYLSACPGYNPPWHFWFTYGFNKLFEIISEKIKK